MNMTEIKRLVEVIDFPVLVVDSQGKILGVSPIAKNLLWNNQLIDADSIFTDIIASTDDFLSWLVESQTLRPVQFVLPGMGMVEYVLRARPLGDGNDGNDQWLISIHTDDSVERKQKERELLTRISSVPIPDMMSEQEEFI